MHSSYERYKIFISSPGDVRKERSLAIDAINEVNKSCKDPLGLIIEPFAWEDLPPIAPGLPEESIQDVINESLRECHAFIFILYKRYGSIDKGQSVSNTEREINAAIEMLERDKRVMLLTYFRESKENNPDPGPEEQKIIDLKRRLDEKQIWYKKYYTPKEFKDQLTHDLYKTVLRYRHSTIKHRALRSFWQFGLADSELEARPSLAVIYPPVGTFAKKSIHSNYRWDSRLVPHIVFEDFKAMLKIQKCLRLIGFWRYKFYSSDMAPINVEDMNRVWVCLPRNPKGLQKMDGYQNKLLFRFTPATPKAEARLFWRRNISSSFFRVKSPLSKYLELQRDGTDSIWHSSLGRIVAKDYAVLARVSEDNGFHTTPLKDYFIAGIRGLGTWGSSWFIDRRSKLLSKNVKGIDDPIQLLLEVVYQNGDILDVKDVSNMPDDYFRDQFSMKTIRKEIERFS